MKISYFNEIETESFYTIKHLNINKYINGFIFNSDVPVQYWSSKQGALDFIKLFGLSLQIEIIKL